MDQKIKQIMDTVLTAACISLLIAILITVSIGVFTRYILNDPAGWTEELARYFLVWLTLLGAPLGCLNSAHIGIHFLPNALSPRGKLILSMTISAVLVLFCVFMFFGGMKLTTVYWKSRSVTMGFPIGFVYMSLCFSSALIILATILVCVEIWSHQCNAGREASC